MTDLTAFPQPHTFDTSAENLRAGSMRWFSQSLAALPEFQLYTSDSNGRDQVEAYIANQFETVYDAKISSFMPFLITMNCLNEVSATAGMRPAGSAPLFLEQYLAQPVEQSIAALSGNPDQRKNTAERTITVERKNIIEIGNLAATRRGSSQLLFLILTGLLHHTQFEWIVFTGNNQVARSLQRLGVELHNLGDADPEQLTVNSKSDWGSYYQGNPHVFSANIPQGKLAMDNSKLFGAVFKAYQSTINSLALSVNSRVLAND